MAAGCKAPPTRPEPPFQSTEQTQSVEQLCASVAEDARRSDHESNSQVRAQLAADADRDAQACLQRAPRAAACLYYHGIALGLTARAHPLHAADTLKSMLEALAAAEAADSEFDQAGPARVQALVLIKAPAWPLGPGDPQAGLAAARRAVSLRPDYPPNELALAEAMAKNGDTQGAEGAYSRARDLIQALPPSADRDDWLKAANQALAAGSPRE